MTSLLHELRRLSAGHPGGAGRNRLREIILARRPALALGRDGIVDEPVRIDDFDENARNALSAIAATASRSVGRVVVERGDGEPTGIGTAFRLKGFDRRMVTNRHLLPAMLEPGFRIGRSRPFAAVRGAENPVAGEGLHPCRVVFDEGRSRRIDPKLVWAHPRWDLLLFDLLESDGTEPPDDDLPGLEIETRLDWGSDGWVDGICVIGFPSSREGSRAPDAVDPFTAGIDGRKYLSPGLRNGERERTEGAARISPRAVDESASRFLGRHDASTLRGSSGSPVISIETGRVIGVHATPGEYDFGVHLAGGQGAASTGNGFVQLAPALARESRLVREMIDPDRHVEEEVDWQPPEAAEAGGGEAARPLMTRLFEDGSDLLSAVASDMPDTRDAEYVPAFSVVPDTVLPTPAELPLLREQSGPDCVGHAVAAAVDISLARAGFDAALFPVSARMIYETARLFDEFADDRIGGSSLRGALKGLFHSGVCTLASEPGPEEPWFLDLDRAREAREVRLTAYYRLRANISDIQHAVATSGAVLVSAHVHDGWRPENANGTIPWPERPLGRHAFVIVGYGRDGWYVLNSWGARWSSLKRRQGVALWTYEDWRENALDAWVLQVAPRTPKAFEVPAWVQKAASEEGGANVPESPLDRLPLPRRHSLIGHAVQLERDVVSEGGRLGLGLTGLRETALHLGEPPSRRKYRSIAVVCHDPFLTATEVARLAGEIVGPLKRDGIYPLNLAYGLDEAETVRLRMASDAKLVARRTRGGGEDATAYVLRKVARSAAPLVRIFREGVSEAAEPGGSIWQVVTSLDLEAGPFGLGRRRRELLILALGAGSLVADAVARVLSPEDGGAAVARRLDIAGLRRPATVAGRRAIPLAEQPVPNPALHGFRLDWVDLVAAAAGDLRVHRSGGGVHAHATPLYADIAGRLRRRRLGELLRDGVAEADVDRRMAERGAVEERAAHRL